MAFGASNLIETSDVILKDNEDIFYRRIGENTWCAILEKELKNINEKYNIVNNGIGGANSNLICNHLNELVNDEDDIIILSIGMNDRKIENGMKILEKNLNYIIDYLLNLNKTLIIITPTISTKVNENYPNRIYHTEDVLKVLRNVSKQRNIMLIDIYSKLLEYYQENNILVDEIMTEEGCRNDGLHPTNKVQILMEKIIFEFLM